MVISGYSFVRNAIKLAYPLKESILSILDLVDEFVIAYCEGDSDDNTLEVINSIKNSKIKIVKATWKPEKYTQNTLYSYLSDVAKNECAGDWLFYLQADEVVHEKYLPIIKSACINYLNDIKIEGLLFNYRHFWGDYDHCLTRHGWYLREIRIIKNLSQIHSWRDAQSFRFYSHFEPTAYFYQTKEGARKLNVALIPTEIFHYGFVRPPSTMSNKQDRMNKTLDANRPDIEIKDYDYGLLHKVPKFKGSHPIIMEEKINAINWKNQLHYEGEHKIDRILHKHEKLKYRIRTWIELNLLGGREIGGFKNYKIVAKFKS